MWSQRALVCLQLLVILILAESSDNNTKDVTAKTQLDDSDSTKFHCLGCETVQNPNDSSYYELAKKSLIKYLKGKGLKNIHKVTTVNKVLEQIVSGVSTKINFDASPTNCSLNDNEETSFCEVLDDSDSINCQSKIWEQSWLSSTKIIISCDKKHRTKRGVAGGQEEQDPNEPEYTNLATESLQKYVNDNGLTETHQVVQVKKVTQQVVAGLLTRIDFDAIVGLSYPIKCHSEIWDRAWLNLKIFNVTCDYNKSQKDIPPIPGGVTEQNKNDPMYRKLAVESLQKYADDNGITRCHEVLRVKKVTTQLVAGTLTKIDFDGRLDSLYDIVCHSEIAEQPWLMNKNIDVTCKCKNCPY